MAWHIFIYLFFLVPRQALHKLMLGFKFLCQFCLYRHFVPMYGVWWLLYASASTLAPTPLSAYVISLLLLLVYLFCFFYRFLAFFMKAGALVHAVTLIVQWWYFSVYSLCSLQFKQITTIWFFLYVIQNKALAKDVRCNCLKTLSTNGTYVMLRSTLYMVVYFLFLVLFWNLFVEFKEHKTQEEGELCIDKYRQIFGNSQLACLD